MNTVLENVTEAAETFRQTAPAGKLVDPDKAALRIQESVKAGTNPALDTASDYLLLAAMNICDDAMKSFAYFLSHPKEDDAEYMAMDGKRATNQISRVLSVIAELKHLDD